jgi:hypothetical protein
MAKSIPAYGYNLRIEPWPGYGPIGNGPRWTIHYRHSSGAPAYVLYYSSRLGRLCKSWENFRIAKDQGPQTLAFIERIARERLTPRTQETAQ